MYSAIRHIADFKFINNFLDPGFASSAS